MREYGVRESWTKQFVVDVREFAKIRKNDVTLRCDNTIFKVIITSTLNRVLLPDQGNSLLGYNKVTNYRKQILVIL